MTISSVTLSKKGTTYKEAKAVCRLASLLNGEIRTSRCTPRSPCSNPKAWRPRIMNSADEIPASVPSEMESISMLNPRRSAQREYIRTSISAQS